MANNQINNAFADNFTAPNKVSKNLMPAGNFSTNPWQRGTTFTSIAGNAYSADRFRYVATGAITAVLDITKDADSPSVNQANIYSTHCMKIACTTAQGTIANGDTLLNYYGVEGYDFTNIAQRSFTLSFWVKSNLPGIYCVCFRNTAVDRSYVAEYIINSASTWEFKTITVTASPTSGTWNYTNGVGLFVGFTLAAGATFQTTANAWQTGNFTGTSNQVNFAGSNTNTFQLALIQLESGTVATPYQQLSIQDVSRYCKRYYQSTFPPGTAPAQATGLTSGAFAIRVNRVGSGVLSVIPKIFFPSMRAASSVTTYNVVNAGTSYYNTNLSANSGASSIDGGVGTNSVMHRVTQVAGDLVGDSLIIHASFNAEI